jgi:hypothetical protein
MHKGVGISVGDIETLSEWRKDNNERDQSNE